MGGCEKENTGVNKRLSEIKPWINRFEMPYAPREGPLWKPFFVGYFLLLVKIHFTQQTNIGENKKGCNKGPVMP
jgi:hypothetical protein